MEASNKRKGTRELQAHANNESDHGGRDESGTASGWGDDEGEIVFVLVLTLGGQDEVVDMLAVVVV